MRFTFTPQSQDFPAELWRVQYPPSEIQIEGKLEALELLRRLPEKGLAIVGSRTCQTRSGRVVREVLETLSGYPLIILSGLARGVDTEAHLAALDCGFPTIAILGCGLDVAYPRENDELRNRIVESGGLVISEFPANLDPMPWSFLRRNRLIAGWSKATWIVQAGFRSGALNTAKWARDHDRDCFATPSFPGDPSMLGNLGLFTRDEKPAKPLWSALSLGETWLELESFLVTKSKPKSAPSNGDHDVLLSEIRLRSAQRGGVAVSELISWALMRQISIEDFFARLRTASSKGEIRIQNGIIAALKFR